ncbi:hypothetical protein [Acidipila sp. EB88]|uniref:DUF4760 domain-containing protein n=1 Tax=Acidipila sp. EB88 TaxID=2305226 RepID=UPI000F5DC792|nr:hypothetical protein [Acidipila sp. EB88]RRA48064.1 hypothetical protein D1Y84_06930 [Acidipila sp. EB88]
MTTSLATTEEAQLILKLYELRTEEGLRAARAWVTQQFWPKSAEDVFAIFGAAQSLENNYIRQVSSYWDMAISFVLHGALSADLFVDCNAEPFFIYSKMLPLLPALRERMPTYLAKTEALVERSRPARDRVDGMLQALSKRTATEDVATRPA